MDDVVLNMLPGLVYLNPGSFSETTEMLINSVRVWKFNGYLLGSRHTWNDK